MTQPFTASEMRQQSYEMESGGPCHPDRCKVMRPDCCPCSRAAAMLRQAADAMEKTGQFTLPTYAELIASEPVEDKP